VPLVILLILCRRAEPWAVLIHTVAAIALAEFYWMALQEDPVWIRLVGLALGTLASVVLFWFPKGDVLLVLLTLVTLVTAILHLIKFGDLQSVSGRMALMVFGILYIPLLLTPIGLMKRLPEGNDWIFLTLTLTFFSDTGAYAAGRALGRHKLYPAISPGKTVEGSAGGLLASLGAGVLAKLWYMPQVNWWDVLVITLGGGALAQCGDLVESMIKRGCRVKDSGWLIPGHGGLLDRIDALLFSTPWVYLYALHAFSGRLA
jgi:phosphatidate cytidylyltransferase